MASNRDKGIIAYGTPTDRQKVTVLARLAGVSNSEFIIQMIRDRYAAVLGDIAPELIPLD